MVLVDTTIWIDHLRRGDAAFAAVLAGGSVLIHPLVIEELACGDLRPRAELLTLFETLPKPPSASHQEISGFVSRERLHGAGIGAVDAHLLASARLARATLWSRDQALRRAAQRLGILEPRP